MEILKKIGGYLLMIIAILLAMAVLTTLPNSISQSLDRIRKTGTLGIAYFVGTMIVNVIFTLLIIFMIKKGLKLIQNRKKESDDTIDKIGL